jgi:hypothetical protein
MLSLKPEDRDRLCRFNYPIPLVPESSMDEHGKVSQKRLDENVVGYNPTISRSFQCNTDAKFVGSGPLGMALSIYMTHYAAKPTGANSAVIMSALAAAMKAMQKLTADPNAPVSRDDERCRKLLLKTLNQINGRRELSGQQVACALLGILNHVTDARFAVFHWSKLLTWISPEQFPPYTKVKDHEEGGQSTTFVLVAMFDYSSNLDPSSDLDGINAGIPQFHRSMKSKLRYFYDTESSFERMFAEPLKLGCNCRVKKKTSSILPIPRPRR